MQKKISNILFSPAVRAIQNQQNSSSMIERLEARDHWQNRLSPEQMDFIQQRNSFYFGTASKDGQPYIQHRGGEKGFIHVVSPSSLWFPDFSGNRQYISVGNLSENDQAYIFFMDYPNRHRLKLWGRAYVKNTDNFPIQNLSKPHIERVIQFEIEALDENCSQYILPRYTEEHYLSELHKAKQEITELKQKIALLEGK